MAVETTLNTPICFVDCETTGVHPGRRAWEVAIIRREPDGQERTLHAFIADVDLSASDPYGLKVGRFYERHPAYNDVADRALTDDPWHGQRYQELPGGARILYEQDTAVRIERMTRGAHLVGAVPNFDAEVFADMLRRHHLTPAWHYHLIDVETLAVGYMGYKLEHQLCQDIVAEMITPPWNSDTLSRLVHVEPASDDERHTALGGARWAMRLYDAIVGKTTADVVATHA